MKLLKRFLIFILLCLPACETFADKVMLGQWSNHFRKCVGSECPESGFNENHKLIGYISDENIMVYCMVNSFEKSSIFLGGVWDYRLNRYMTPYITVGVISGYEHTLPSIAGFSAAGFLGLDLHPPNKSFSISISLVPDQIIAVGLVVPIN